VDASHGELTFVGTATTVLRLGGFTLLTDPNFLRRGQRAHLGYGLWSKRRTDPARRPEELPPLDAVVLSHLHGDHFDRVARRWLPADLPVVTTPHAARRLGRRAGTTTHGLGVWDRWSLERGTERLHVTAVPGRHARGPLARVLPPVMGTVVDLERDGGRVLRLYVTGDTLVVPELREIRERFPGIDVMVAHLGGTRILGTLVTMDARQGADLARLISPGAVVPVHYDDYDVFRSPLTHTVDELRRQGLAARLHVVHRGDTVALPVPAVRGSEMGR
jgi:L-ascorbate metabolism protein UlaG (beta-lactamase superfamily)